MVIMVISKAMPGKKVIQYLPLIIYSNPFDINNPKEGSVIGNPIPRKLSVASKEMACAVCTVTTTIIGGMQFGRR